MRKVLSHFAFGVKGISTKGPELLKPFEKGLRHCDLRGGDKPKVFIEMANTTRPCGIALESGTLVISF